MRRLCATRLSPREGVHIRLRDPVPDHLASMEVSAFAHGVASCIVVKEIDCRSCDCSRILKGNQCATPIIEKLGGVPVGNGDDGFPRAHGKSQGPRYRLRHVTVRRDVNVGRPDQRGHLLRTEEPVVEYYFSLDSQFPGQGLQLIPVSVAFASSDMRVGGSCDHVDNVAVAGEDARQGANHALESLVRRQQAEGEQYKLSRDGERVFVNLRLHEGQIGNSMRHQIDLFAGHAKYISQNARGLFAHHNKSIGERGDLLDDPSLIEVRLTENGMKRCYHRHGEALQQLQDMTASLSPKDPLLVLQTH